MAEGGRAEGRLEKSSSLWLRLDLLEAHSGQLPLQRPQWLLDPDCWKEPPEAPGAAGQG